MREDGPVPRGLPSDSDFESWVRDNWPKLVAVARVIAIDHELAKDVLQEALIDVYVHWSRISTYGNPVGYVCRVMVSKAANQRRSSWSRRVDLVDISLYRAQSRSDPAKDVVNRESLTSALREIPIRARSVVAMYYLLDRTAEETSQALNIPLGTVTSDLTRARRSLREILGVDYD